MKAYISSSLNDSEKYIITLLTMHLQENGFTVTTNFNDSNEIIHSHLVIGILSRNGSNQTNVIEDWKFARRNRIPNLLLVENDVRLSAETSKLSTVIRFNRYFPESSINEVKRKINPEPIVSRSKLVRTRKSTKQNEKNQESVAWLLGGAALITLIALLSSDKSK